jgi:hypothetical protein
MSPCRRSCGSESTNRRACTQRSVLVWHGVRNQTSYTSKQQVMDDCQHNAQGPLFCMLWRWSLSDVQHHSSHMKNLQLWRSARLVKLSGGRHSTLAKEERLVQYCWWSDHFQMNLSGASWHRETPWRQLSKTRSTTHAW